MTYSLVANSSAVRRAVDGATIPPDPENLDWQAYQTWLGQGNVATPAAIVAPSPVTCALWQLQSVMTPAQWDNVTTAVAALGNPAVSAFFQHGTNVIPANSTTLASIAAAIGLTPAQASELVAQAAAVTIP